MTRYIYMYNMYVYVYVYIYIHIYIIYTYIIHIYIHTISYHITSYHRRKRLQISCYHATFCLGTEGPTHPEDDTTGSQVLFHFGWQPGRRCKSWDQSHGLKTKWIICNRFIYVLYIYLYISVFVHIYVHIYTYIIIHIYICRYMYMYLYAILSTQHNHSTVVHCFTMAPLGSSTEKKIGQRLSMAQVGGEFWILIF